MVEQCLPESTDLLRWLQKYTGKEYLGKWREAGYPPDMGMIDRHLINEELSQLRDVWKLAIARVEMNEALDEMVSRDNNARKGKNKQTQNGDEGEEQEVKYQKLIYARVAKTYTMKSIIKIGMWQRSLLRRPNE